MVDVLTILALIPLYIDLCLRLIDRKKIDFRVEKLYEPTKKPIDSDWRIRIRSVSKPIEKCSVLYNDNLIPWSDGDDPSYYEKSFDINTGGSVLIPKGKENKDAEIIIQNNNKKLKKVKFKDLLKSK